MAINLTDDRRNEFLTRLQSLFYTEFDEDLSDFRAEAILDLALEMLGPTVYNQAVQDARAYFQTKLDDLDGEVHAPET
jgi:uncharacterized protein (DUF2164 family)